MTPGSAQGVPPDRGSETESDRRVQSTVLGIKGRLGPISPPAIVRDPHGPDHVIELAAADPEQAAGVLTTVKRDQLTREGQPFAQEEEDAIRQPILAKYEEEGSPYYSTARLWDDGILDPAETRQALALGLSAAYNAPIPAAKFGVFRM